MFIIRLFALWFCLPTIVGFCFPDQVIPVQVTESVIGSLGSIVAEVLGAAASVKKTDGSPLTVDAVVAASGAIHKIVLDQSQEKIASQLNHPELPESVTNVVGAILTAMPVLQDISTNWVKTLLRAGNDAELVGLGQSVRASLPKDVDKLIRAAEVAQKFKSSNSFEKASFETPTDARLLLADLCQLGALAGNAELMDIFPNGPALLKGCSEAVGNHIGNVISQLSGCKKGMASVLSQYQGVISCGQADLDFEKYKHLLDERNDDVSKSVQACITGTTAGGVFVSSLSHVCVWLFFQLTFNTSTIGVHGRG